MIQENPLVLDRVVKATGEEIPPEIIQEIVWLGPPTGFEITLDKVSSVLPIGLLGAANGLILEVVRRAFPGDISLHKPNIDSGNVCSVQSCSPLLENKNTSFWRWSNDFGLLLA
jgi:hypothetical protein